MEDVGVDFTKLFGRAFYGKKVLVTGHTGFKGSWLSLWLHLMGAKVIGYALPPTSELDNFVLCGLNDKITDVQGDIRDREHLKEVFKTYEPEIVFHLAAQPIVRCSYEQPVTTLDTNIMGTVNILENIRNSDSVQVGIIITSDKCYENKEQIWGYREQDALGGFDPYSASKGCAEIVTAAYRSSFFGSGQNSGYEKAVSTVRAGNVIGGGDWSPNRIIPDCVRALRSGSTIEVRSPKAVRPWQFVLEPLYGYLLLASKMLKDPVQYSGAWNFGPDFDSVVPVNEVVNLIIHLWGGGNWKDLSGAAAVHEAGLLNLDCTKAKVLLGWKQRLPLHETLEQTLSWYKTFESTDVCGICEKQLAGYCAKCMM